MLLLLGGGLGVVHFLGLTRTADSVPTATPPPAQASIYSIAPPSSHLPPPPAAPRAGNEGGGADPADAVDGDGTQTISRIMIPAIAVDAPIVVRGLDEHRVMESPDQPFDVAWYDFTGVPGRPGNAVFSGHLDFAQVGPAAFWNLPDVQTGDVVDIVMGDGTIYRYQVTIKTVYREETAPVRQIVGPTANETITLITCVGEFDRRTGRYSDRLIVRAERVKT